MYELICLNCTVMKWVTLLWSVMVTVLSAWGQLSSWWESSQANGLYLRIVSLIHLYILKLLKFFQVGQILINPSYISGVTACLENKSLVSEEQFEIIGSTQNASSCAPRRARAAAYKMVLLLAISQKSYFQITFMLNL